MLGGTKEFAPLILGGIYYNFLRKWRRNFVHLRIDFAEPENSSSDETKLSKQNRKLSNKI